MKLLGCVLCKNDEFIIGKCLSRLSEVADAIIVLDDGSTDRTVEIVKSFDKVIKVIENPPFRKWDSITNLKMLYDEMCKIKPEWVFLTDSDEVIDKRFVEQRDALLDAPGVVKYTFEEITLWRGTTHYRVDKPEIYSRKASIAPFLIKWSDDVKHYVAGVGFKYGLMRYLARTWGVAMAKRYIPRLKGKGKLASMANAILYPKDYMDHTNGYLVPGPGKVVNLELKKIHYHFVDNLYITRKHMNYALQAAVKQHRKEEEIWELIYWATSKLSEEGLQLAPVKEEWGVL